MATARGRQSILVTARELPVSPKQLGHTGPDTLQQGLFHPNSAMYREAQCP